MMLKTENGTEIMHRTDATDKAILSFVCEHPGENIKTVWECVGLPSYSTAIYRCKTLAAMGFLRLERTRTQVLAFPVGEWIEKAKAS